MADNDVSIELVLELKKLNDQLTGVEKKAGSTGKKIGNNLSKGVSSNFGKTFSLLNGRVLALGASLLAVFGGRRIIQAAQVQEDAINKLNVALKNAGDFSEAASQDMQNFASELQSVTTIGDETSLEMLSLAKAMGATNEQAKDLVLAATNLSAATGISLESAVKNLGKTFGGLTGELGETVPALRNLTQEQLKAGAAIDFVNKRFAGAAADLTRSFSGRITQISNLFGDILEQIGLFATQSPVVSALLGQVATSLNSIIEQLRGVSGDVFGDFIKDSIRVASSITGIVLPPLELMLNVFNEIGKSIGVVAASITQLLSGNFQQALADIQTGFQEFQEGIFDFNLTERSEAFLEDLNGFVNSVKEPAKELGKQIGESVKQGIQQPVFEATSFFKEAWNQTFSETALTSKAFQKELQGRLTATFKSFRIGVATSFASIGQALVKGENAFAAFGKAILGVFGDLAIQLGSFYFLLGLANLFLNPAAAAAQIAGGLALIVLGGALKAVAGGGGGAGAPGTSAGGVPTEGGQPLTDSFLEGDDSITQNEEQTSVTVNIQGNVLDRRETGLEIAEIINDTFGSNGVTIAEASA